MANEDAIERALTAARDGIDEDLPKVGLLWTNAVKVILSQPGGGRYYGAHRASAPGQAPAVDTGAYRASWTFAVQGKDTVAMYPGPSPHPSALGGWLEFGTSKMAARPHVRPTNAQVAPLITSVFGAGIVRREERA